MDTIQATRLRKGNLVKMNGELYRVLEMIHVSPGKGKAFVQVKLRNVRAGTQQGTQQFGPQYVLDCLQRRRGGT